jgi:hypothetical protein
VVFGQIEAAAVMSLYLVPLFIALLAAYGLAAYGLGAHNSPRPTPAQLPKRQPGASLVWLPDNPYSPVTEAGDRAALQTLLRQKERDERYRGRAKHAAEWLTDVTGEYAVVAVEYPKEIAA